MKQKLVLFILLVFSAFYVSAQKDEILLKIGNKEIGKEEYERIYIKNNNNLFNESDRKTAKEYLDLFINYKLKVIEAENLQMDTSREFREELEGYRAELAAPYLTDVKFNQELVKTLYDRMNREIDASHILLRLNQDATAGEVQEVLERITNIRDEILAGKDFGEAAVEYSEDPSATKNRGNLGYFTAFQMVAPFEDAAFNLSVGEVSEPVRTSFGYHLIKLNNVRQNKGEVKVAHIMKMFPRGVKYDKSKIKAEIDSVYQALLNGADFAKMAEKYSDDKRSASQGGELPWFSEGRMVPEFAEPAFTILKTGEFTKPVETAFGYHIIKLLDHRDVPSFENAKADIEKRIKQDPERSITSKKAFIDELKTEYNFSENKENIAQLKGIKIGENVEDKNNVLFTIDNKNFRAADLTGFVTNRNITAGSYLLYYDRWVEAEITDLEDSKLEGKYPDFRFLLQEYHDGILLFNIMEEKIWNFAGQDSSGLESFYSKNRKNYMWGDRFKGSIITCENADVRAEAEKYFSVEMQNSEITDLLNQDGNQIQITEGAWEKGTNPVVDFYVWNGSEPDNFDSGLTFVRGDLIPPEPKTLEDARGLYIADYQNYLEKEWLKQLHKKYKIKVKKRVLKSIPDA